MDVIEPTTAPIDRDAVPVAASTVVVPTLDDLFA